MTNDVPVMCKQFFSLVTGTADVRALADGPITRVHIPRHNYNYNHRHTFPVSQRCACNE